MPAMIFRKLATQAGVLQAFWQCLGPLYRQGLLQESAWALTRKAGRDELLPALEPDDLRAFGLHEGATLGRALATLDNYNRANPVNWLALLSLLQAARRSPQPGAACAADAIERAWLAPAPPDCEPLPLRETEHIDAPTRWLLNDLREGDRSELDPVVPSLYRHFMDCPGLLQWLHRHLAPRFAGGQMAADLRPLRQAMKEEASRWAERLGPVPQALRAPDVLQTLEQFSSQVIPPMVLIGSALRRSIDAALRPAPL